MVTALELEGSSFEKTEEGSVTKVPLRDERERESERRAVPLLQNLFSTPLFS